MKIGIDFDNTLVCCDDLFCRAALEKGLIPAGTSAAKDQVRDYLRKSGREDAWTELQGAVYGSLIQRASPFPGVIDFLLKCRHNAVPVVVISHKTRTPFLGHPYDLHKAARDWLENQGFLKDFGLTRAQIFFELTRQDKMNRIAQETCTHFIDDLPEFLGDPQFPAPVQRILFDPQKQHAPPKNSLHMNSWREIQRSLFPE